MQSRCIKGLLLGAVFVVLVGLLCQGAVRVNVLLPIKEEGPGEFVTHVFSVTNDGATPEAFLIETEVPEGWGLLGVPTGLSLAAGQERTLSITVSVPPDASVGEYSVTLRAISQTDPADRASADAVISVVPVNEVELVPPNGGSVTPGQEILYPFTIVNRGNAQDTFQIEASSANQFSLHLSKELLSLAPQERAAVDIRLQVPLDAGPGRDLLTFRATSTIYPAVGTEVTLFTTILPPPPQAVGGTLMEELAARLRCSITQDIFDGELTSNLTFSVTGGVQGGYFSALLRASPIFGPDPLEIGSFSALYRRTPATYVFGDTSKTLTDLLSLSCRGGKAEIDADKYGIVFLGGGSDGETRVGGHLVLGPEEANVGIAYLERRDETDQQAIWSLTAGAKPFEDWALSLEGALGMDNRQASHGVFSRSKIDTTSYFLNAEAWSVGTYFPGLRSDTAGISFSQRLRLEDLSLSTSFGHVWDNVIRDPLVTTTITDRFGANLYVTPHAEGPTITSTVGFTWERDKDLILENEIERFLSVGLSDTQGAFPYAFSAELSDEIDRVAGTHYRTLTFSEGAGLSIEDFALFLKATQEETKDYLAGDTLAAGNTISLRFNSRGALHSVRISLTNIEDAFNLSLQLGVSMFEDLRVLFNGALGWDRADATEATFQCGVGFDLTFDLPIPFLVTKGRIEGQAFIDRDGDGHFSPGDGELDRIVVATKQSEVSTDEKGMFRFPPFSPGTYTLELRHLPPDAARASSIRIDLEAGEVAWAELPVAPVVIILGVLFDDVDQGGFLTEGEGGFAEVRVVLMDSEEVVAEAYTDLDGRFSIRNVLPGQYTVAVDHATLPTRFAFTTPEEIIIEVGVEAPPTIQFGGYIKPREPVITFQPPIAEFIYEPERPKAGEVVEFDASASFDFDGEIISYEWDFDADGQTDATGLSARYTFASSGAHAITLTVTDEGGNSDALTYTINVE